jgi:hypothetical protein
LFEDAKDAPIWLRLSRRMTAMSERTGRVLGRATGALRRRKELGR